MSLGAAALGLSGVWPDWFAAGQCAVMVGLALYSAPRGRLPNPQKSTS